MMDLDDLSNALRDAAAAQPEVADRLVLVTQRGRRQRRRAQAVLGGITAVVLVAGGLLVADGGDPARVRTLDRPPDADSIEAGDPCPGSVTRRVDGGDPEADALPPLSEASVDRGRVSIALAEHRDELLEGFGASRVDIGAGFGRAWVGENGGDYSVVDVEDFGILLEVPDEAACPQGGALHQKIEGVPLFFFVNTTGATSKAPDRIGALGPNGGVIWDGREMQSTPEELFDNQDDGSTVVFSEAPPTSTTGLLRFYLGAERTGEHLCVTLSPYGKTGPLTQMCEIPAYRSGDQIVEEAFVGEGVLDLDGIPTRVVYGMTYLDAASVSLGDDTEKVELQSGLPFWMHRFFALTAPEDTTEVRLLDSQGNEITRVQIGGG